MKKESKVIVVSTILTTTVVTSFTLFQGPIVLADENYTKIASRENIKNYDMNDEKENKTELKEDIVLEKDFKNLKVKNDSYTNITNSQVKSNTQPSTFNNTSTIKPQVIPEESKEPIVSKPIDPPIIEELPTEEEPPTEELPTPEPPIVETPEEIPLDQDINSSEFTEETGL
ncbi:hypothetical protein UMC2_02111 [[Clostridium] sordellii]|uniref:hypothetical protein n=1 Tax=Paraclostridium sordellii TaxID=1505 RepID=UPI000541E5F3|nr:hypothetical protein [Paeniclostridium sordellii]CEK32961.1 hypothetical protein UMC2_02111 [[Clostridium] sordellii] [Paeniclostridium sordellii]